MNAITKADIVHSRQPAAARPVARTRAPIDRLPDQLEIKFGPTEALGRFVLRADRTLRNHGIRLSLSTDFAELAALNARHLKNWFALPPMFDPVFARLGADNAFWLKGVNDAGETVLSHAMRLYVWPHTTLKEEAESLRMLYDNVGLDLPGAYGEVVAPSAPTITGRVGYMGALWLHGDYRGQKLAGVVSPLTRAVGLARWYPTACFSFVSTSSVEKGRAALYGWSPDRVEPGINFFGLPGGHDQALEFSMCWMTAAEIEEVVLDTVAAKSKRNSARAPADLRQAAIASGAVL